MTQPKVSETSKFYDLTFKINCESTKGEIYRTEMTVRVSKLCGGLGEAIEGAKKHIRTKLINFHSIA